MNKGSTIHALEIEGGDVEEETEPIPAGASPARRPSLDDDTAATSSTARSTRTRTKGMEGSIVVGTGSSTSGDTDDDDDGSSAGY